MRIRSLPFFSATLRRLATAVLLVVSCLPVAVGQFHDGSQVTFGKNRVQYRDFTWSYYPLESGIEVYHYQGGQELAQRVVRMLPAIQEDIETLMDRTLEPPLQVLVYNKQSEFRQSNIGASLGEDANIGGTATLVNGKLFLYGTGSTDDLTLQLRKGLARILFQQIIYGGSWQDALRNSSAVQFPDWFTEGLFSYASVPDSPALTAALADDARRGAFGRIEQADEAELARLGHGVWKFVADIFGRPTVANVIYMSRVSRSVESGFLFAIGMDLNTLLQEAAAYHAGELEEAEAELPPLSTRKERRVARRDGGDLPVKLKRHLQYQRVALHPEGQLAAVATEERGQVRVWLVDLAEGSQRSLARHGAKIDRIQDDTYPVFAWHPNGRVLTYTLEERGRVFLVNIDIETGEKIEKELFRIDKVLAMDYAPDGRSIVLSGVREGRSDLYLYQVIGNTQAPLWEDAFDDLTPRFLPSGDQIVFTSNRPSPTWPDNASPTASAPGTDVFVLNLADGDAPFLTQWTNTPGTSERLPQPWTDNRVVFLRESPGSNAQKHVLAWRDSAVAAIDTTIHYRYFTDEQLIAEERWPLTSVEWLPDLGQTASTRQHAGHLYWQLTDAPRAHTDGATLYRQSGGTGPADLPDWRWTPGEGEVDFRDYVFGPLAPPAPESPAKGPEAKPTLDGSTASGEPPTDAPTAPLPKPRNYRMNYALESVTSQLDNTFGGTFYQVYTGVTSVQPGLGALTKVSATDLFEDRRFVAGFRLAGSLENSTYAIGYSDLSRRIDRSLSLERQGQQQFTPNGQSLIETHIHTLRYKWSYPFDEVRSLRLNAVYRLDRNAYLATDAYNLALPTTFNNAAGFELSYVFDATRQRTLNIREGRRSKVWAELYVDPAEQSKTFGTIGFDYRNYFSIYGDFIFAVRAAADVSIGSDRLLHMLGGVDNALALAQNAGTPIDPNINYAYQTRITPLRGFSTNARNGSHMALVNAELRLPVASTFVRKPIKSDFIRHFQVVGFLDCGTAWNGLHPYSADNTFNQTSVEQNPITVTIDNNREPIIGATGFGLRSRVLGYWLRGDWGWGVDNGRWQKRVFTLAFSMDF